MSLLSAALSYPLYVRPDKWWHQQGMAGLCVCTLAMRRSVYGDVAHPDIAESLNNIAMCHSDSGDYWIILLFVTLPAVTTSRHCECMSRFARAIFYASRAARNCTKVFMSGGQIGRWPNKVAVGVVLATVWVFLVLATLWILKFN